MTSRGYTLVELLVTAMLVALLVAIALPSYRQVVLRAQRSDARLALLRIQAQQERHYLQHQRYSRDLATPPAAGGLGVGSRSDAGHYALSLQLNGDGLGYLAIARPAPGDSQQEDRECASLSIDETGRRLAEAAQPAHGIDAVRCWG